MLPRRNFLLSLLGLTGFPGGCSCRRPKNPFTRPDEKDDQLGLEPARHVGRISLPEDEYQALKKDAEKMQQLRKFLRPPEAETLGPDVEYFTTHHFYGANGLEEVITTFIRGVDA